MSDLTNKLQSQLNTVESALAAEKVARKSASAATADALGTVLGEVKKELTHLIENESKSLATDLRADSKSIREVAELQSRLALARIENYAFTQRGE
jgi:hypothetical protein